jgi:hypothetical protein
MDIFQRAVNQHDLRLVCAWCAKVLRAGKPGAGITHGICPSCLQQADGAVPPPRDLGLDSFFPRRARLSR